MIHRDASSTQNVDVNERALMIAAITIGSIGLVATLAAMVFYFRKVSTARVGLTEREGDAAGGGVQAGELRLTVVRQGTATARPAPPKGGSDDKGQTSSAQI
jgi:hypothetical protein